MIEQLTRDDYNDLLEALDKMIEGEKSSALLTGILGAMVSGSKLDAEKVMAASHEDFKKKTGAIADKVVLLKAKLIKLRDALDIEDFMSEIGDVS